MTGKEVLKIEMLENDADAKTIKGYLQALLWELWNEGEGFSGKRPFGNSGWDHELFRSLVAAKAVKGSLDEDGYIEIFDEKEANRLICLAIEAL